jgi:predicted transcriptional regulator of viral defense system
VPVVEQRRVKWTRESRGVPAGLEARPIRVFRTQDAARFYAHPRDELKRLTDQGLLVRLHAGLYAIVPPEARGVAWRPELEAAAGAIAAALWDVETTAIMGVSAARVHRAIPRALATAVVAAPAQHAPIALADREATIRFSKRDIVRLDVERIRTALGDLLVTTVEQTALDLAHRPELGDVPQEARAAARVLRDRGDPTLLEQLAEDQHRPTALTTLRNLPVGADGAAP